MELSPVEYNDPLGYAANHFICPVTRLRLTDAVLVLPCLCRLSREAFKSEAPSSVCPSCEGRLKKYISDPKTCKATKEFFKRVGKSHMVLDIDEAKPPIPSEIPYPEKIKGDFDIYEENGRIIHLEEEEDSDSENVILDPEDICKRGIRKGREGHFILSSENDPFFKEVRFICNQLELSLCLRFSTDIYPKEDLDDEFIRYLNGQGLFLDDYEIASHCYSTEDKELIEKCYEILLRNTNFPQKIVEKMRILINERRD